MKKSEEKNIKLWTDLFEKIEEKILPNLAFYADKFELGIIDISVTDEDIVKRYGIIYNEDVFFYELMGNYGFIRLITKDDSDGTFDFYIIHEGSEKIKAKSGLNFVCGELMIDNLICLMEFGNLLMTVLEYYLKKESELEALNKKLDSLENVYQNGLLIEKNKKIKVKEY